MGATALLESTAVTLTLVDNKRKPWVDVQAWIVEGTDRTLAVNPAPRGGDWQVCHATAGIKLAGGFRSRVLAAFAAREAFKLAFHSKREDQAGRLKTWRTPRWHRGALQASWCREAARAFGTDIGAWLQATVTDGKTIKHIRLMAESETIAHDGVPAGMESVARAYADHARGTVALDGILRG